MELEIGKKFSAYEELTTFLSAYEKQEKQKFWKRSSRTLEKVRLKKCFSARIKYYEIHYSCIHGGGEFKSKGKGIKRVRTHRMNCPANIKLRASSDGQSLEIRSFNDKHQYHDLSEVFYEHLPQKRKLTDAERQQTSLFLELETNEKKLQNKILDTSKTQLLEGLSNIQQSLRSNDSDDLQKVIQFIEEMCKGTISILDEDKMFKGLFISTPVMQKNVELWPEFIAFDGTYKLLKNDCTVYIFVVEDSNGESKIGGIGILSVADESTVTWLIQSFKSINPNCINTKCIMSDKDLIQRKILKTEFPEAFTYICLFHSMNIFRRDISCELLGISKNERNSALEFITKLIYSETEDEYNRIYEEFSQYVPEIVLSYYNENWHGIRREWLIQYMNNNFQNNTNHRVESINNKIKQVVKKHSSLLDFVKSFFMFFDSMEHERIHTTAKEVLTSPVIRYARDSPEDKYSKFLTNYSFQYVLGQLKIIKYVTILSQISEDTNIVRTSQGDIKVSNTQCECTDWTSPCCHIFAVRQKNNIELFDKNLCNVRWTRHFSVAKSSAYPLELETNSHIHISSKIKPDFVSLSQKRKSAVAVTTELANLVTYSGNDQFDYRMSVLKEIVNMWRNGNDVSVGKVND